VKKKKKKKRRRARRRKNSILLFTKLVFSLSPSKISLSLFLYLLSFSDSFFFSTPLLLSLPPPLSHPHSVSLRSSLFPVLKREHYFYYLVFVSLFSIPPSDSLSPSLALRFLSICLFSPLFLSLCLSPSLSIYFYPCFSRLYTYFSLFSLLFSVDFKFWTYPDICIPDYPNRYLVRFMASTRIWYDEPNIYK
jgi:hypothetical protein